MTRLLDVNALDTVTPGVLEAAALDVCEFVTSGVSDEIADCVSGCEFTVEDDAVRLTSELALCDGENDTRDEMVDSSEKCAEFDAETVLENVVVGEGEKEYSREYEATFVTAELIECDVFDVPEVAPVAVVHEDALMTEVNDVVELSVGIRVEAPLFVAKIDSTAVRVVIILLVGERVAEFVTFADRLYDAVESLL